MSISPAYQFNIILLNSSAITSCNSITGETEIDLGVASKIEITRPSMRIIEISNIPCLYKTGALYKVKSGEVIFFVTPTGHIKTFIDLPQCLDEWYAEDVPQKEGSILLFLGVLRYDLRSGSLKDNKSIYTLQFLSDEKIVQYPILKLISTDSSSFMTEGEGLVDTAKKLHKKKIEGSLMTVLQEELILLCHSETHKATDLPT